MKKLNRSASIHKQNKIWDEIRFSIDTRPDFLPKYLLKNIIVQHKDNIHNIKSYQEFSQLMTKLMGQYGPEEDFRIKYELNYSKLIEVVDKRYNELFNVKVKSRE